MVSEVDNKHLQLVAYDLATALWHVAPNLRAYTIRLETDAKDQWQEVKDGKIVGTYSTITFKLDENILWHHEKGLILVWARKHLNCSPGVKDGRQLMNHELMYDN